MGGEWKSRQRIRRLGLSGIVVLGFALTAPLAGCGEDEEEAGLPAGAVAIVAEAPEDVGLVTPADLREGLERLAKLRGQELSKLNEKERRQISEAALDELLEEAWVVGNAEELGISVTPSELANRVEEFKAPTRSGQSQYATLVDDYGISPAELEAKLELQVLRDKFEETAEGSATPSEKEIASYYSQHQAEFSEKDARDIRVVFSEDKADAEAAAAMLREDNSPAAWAKAAKRYSDDEVTREDGGNLAGLEEGSAVEPLNAAIFGAPVGAVEGVLKTRLGYSVFEVAETKPGKTESLQEAKPAIEAKLSAGAREEDVKELLSEYEARWKARTTCAHNYTIDRCGSSN